MTQRFLACWGIFALLASAPLPAVWPARTADGQPDIQGVWGGAEQGTWTVFLEDSSRLAAQGLPLSRPSIFFTTRTTALIDPPDGVLPYHPWARERRNSVARTYLTPLPWQVDSETPGWPSGIPRQNAYSSLSGFFGNPIQILQPRGFVVFLYEAHHEFRVIPLDGRPHPGQDIKLWEGASRGRWESNTLVVDVRNNNDSPRLSAIGDFHSDEMTAIERWTFVSQDRIEYTCTVTDPKVFTKPWTMKLFFVRAPAGTELLEYAGAEGAAPYFGFTRDGDPRNQITK